MRFARIELDGHPTPVVVEKDHVRVIEGEPFRSWQETERTIALEDARWLAPVQARQILAIGRNYDAHAKEGGSETPTAPLLFIKAVGALNRPGGEIVLPEMAPDEVDYEAELVVVIGKRAKNVSRDEAPEHIFGYTCGNDVSARDCQLRIDKQWSRGKGFDTFAPMGPWIETELDPSNLRVRTRLNGEVMQDDTTANLIFDCYDLVAYLSRCMTLEPGDVIMTGTPSGVGGFRNPPVFLKPGDTVAVEIEGIGELVNPVVKG